MKGSVFEFIKIWSKRDHNSRIWHYRLHRPVKKTCYNSEQVVNEDTPFSFPFLLNLPFNIANVHIFWMLQVSGFLFFLLNTIKKSLSRTCDHMTRDLHWLLAELLLARVLQRCGSHYFLYNILYFFKCTVIFLTFYQLCLSQYVRFM